MIYSPEKNKGKFLLVFFIGIVILFILFLLCQFKIVTQTLCQFAFFFEAVFYTHILSKFYLPIYTYYVEKNRFIIDKKIGNKIVTVCDVDFPNIVDILSKNEYKKQENYDIKSVYNYNSNIFSNSCYYLIFNYSQRYEAIIFEPSEDMIKMILKLTSH